MSAVQITIRKKSASALILFGAVDGTRTRDLRLTKAVHYQLCYNSIFYYCRVSLYYIAKTLSIFFLHNVDYAKSVEYRKCVLDKHIIM